MRTSRLIAVGLVAMAVASQASAVLPGLASDPNGMPGWQGTKSFDTANLYGVNYYAADIDYCVYDPGQFVESFFDVTVDPSLYVYAYQVTSVTDGTFGAGTGYVTRFSVGLTGGDAQACGLGYVPLSGAFPSSIAFAPAVAPFNTVGWNYAPGIYAGSTSAVMFYCSPFGPEWDNASITGAYGLGDSQLMPSPTPEPATLVVLAAGSALLFRRKRN